MIHQPSAGTQGQITDMAIHLKRLEIIKKRMNKILSENTGKPVETVTADCERDNFMTADEAVAYGLIDKVFDKALIIFRRVEVANAEFDDDKTLKCSFCGKPQRRVRKLDRRTERVYLR